MHSLGLFSFVLPLWRYYKYGILINPDLAGPHRPSAIPGLRFSLQPLQPSLPSFVSKLNARSPPSQPKRIRLTLDEFTMSFWTGWALTSPKQPYSCLQGQSPCSGTQAFPCPFLPCSGVKTEIHSSDQRTIPLLQKAKSATNLLSKWMPCGEEIRKCPLKNSHYCQQEGWISPWAFLCKSQSATSDSATLHNVQINSKLGGACILLSLFSQINCFLFLFPHPRPRLILPHSCKIETHCTGHCKN